MTAFKNIQSLFLQQNLLKLREVGGQGSALQVWNFCYFLGQSFGHILGTRCALYAMWRESCEFRIAFRVKTSVRDKEHFSAARGIGQPAEIGQEFFSSRYVQFAPRKHEIGLGIN